MDWRVYHAINTFVSHHTWLGSLFKAIETYGTVLIGIAAVALWLLARPGRDRRWKLAAASALSSAGVALIVNRIISSSWHRDRPYQTHHVEHLWGPRKTDASLPSDHSSAAFAIAFAVFFFDRVVGSIFLAAAVLIGAGRVIVGAHYPLDVVAGVFVGLGSALLVVRLARPVILALVRLVERLTDPVVGRVAPRPDAGRRT